MKVLPSICIIFAHLLIRKKNNLLWHSKLQNVSWANSTHSFASWQTERISLGTPQVRKDETKCWPVALIQREEHDGTRRYYIEQGNVRIVSGAIEKEGTFVAADKEEQVIPREDFGGAAEFILELLKTTSGTDAIEVPEGLEAFLDAVNIYDLEAKTEDRTGFSQ